MSLKLKRRHLDKSRRAMVAARLANIKVGEFVRNQHVPSANLQTPQISQSDAAAMLQVSARSVASAAKVQDECTALIILGAGINLSPVDVTTARRFVDRVIAANKKRWNVDIKASPTFESLPDDVKQAVAKYGKDTKAKDVFHIGTVHVVADAGEAFRHEILAHLGLNFFDDGSKDSPRVMSRGHKSTSGNIISAKEVTHVVQKLVSNFDHEVPVSVVATPVELPSGSGPVDNNTDAFIQSGRIYILAWRMENVGHILSALWHEILHSACCHQMTVIVAARPTQCNTLLWRIPLVFACTFGAVVEHRLARRLPHLLNRRRSDDCPLFLRQLGYLDGEI